MNEILHLATGAVLLFMGVWITWVQRRGAKVHDLELEVVALKIKAESQHGILEDFQEGLSDVRENMLRRDDLALIKAALRP